MTFQANTTTTYGGGMANESSSPTLTQVTFQANTAQYGGGVYNTASSPTLTAVVFRDNTATDKGGGMRNYAASAAQVVQVTFLGNTATYGGGGLANDTSAPTLINVEFTGNRAGAEGGGMQNTNGSTPQVTNGVFRANRASYGGGVYNSGSAPVLTHATVSGNHATHWGGGLRNYSGSHPTVQNSIVWGNTAGQGTMGQQQVANLETSTPLVASSLIGGAGGSGGGWDAALGTDGGNNLDADPLFINPPDAGADGIWGTDDDDGGDLRLRSGSPAIDVGDNAVIPAGVTMDGHGRPRILNSVVDMGGYEFAGPRLIADTIIGAPVASGDYLFWVDTRDGSDNAAIYGYDVTTRQEFLVKAIGDPADAYHLATDGSTLAWVDRTVPITPYMQIQGYDISTQTEFTIVQPSDRGEFYGLALAQNILYYGDVRGSHRGIYQRDLGSGSEDQVSEHGVYPVVHDETLLWMERDQQGESLFFPEVRLQMKNLVGSQATTLLHTGIGELSGYGISGHHAVWGLPPNLGEERIYLYETQSGITTTLDFNKARYPVINNDVVAWTSWGEDGSHNPPGWAIHTYNLVDETYATAILTGTAPLHTHAILDQHGVVFTTKRDWKNVTSELYLLPLDEQLLNMPQAQRQATSRFTRSAGCLIATGQEQSPDTITAQISVHEGMFYETAQTDDSGCWAMKGVQFFLPEEGIKGDTFHDQVFSNTGITRRWWLDKAAEELHAQMIRVFVDYPKYENDGVSWPTSPETIYQLATEAHEREMRIGLVLHNHGNFEMTPEIEQRLRELIAYLQGYRNGQQTAEDLTPVIAYVNADNEINKHPRGEAGGNDLCSTPQIDCFDQSQEYVDEAVEWVYKFDRIFEGSGILVTVGMSTGMGDQDGDELATTNFFREGTWTDNGTTHTMSLHDIVHFISPHHYGANANIILQRLREERNYMGPIVLEEHGRPTDPLPRDPQGNEHFLREYPQVCLDDPMSSVCLTCLDNPIAEECFPGQCFITDPGNPECHPFAGTLLKTQIDTTQLGILLKDRNEEHFEEHFYAGSVTFMLADTNDEKDCSKIDPYTGLFAASGGSYCDGTITRNHGELKATGILIAHHYEQPYPCFLYASLLPMVQKIGTLLP